MNLSDRGFIEDIEKLLMMQNNELILYQGILGFTAIYRKITLKMGTKKIK